MPLTPDNPTRVLQKPIAKTLPQAQRAHWSELNRRSTSDIYPTTIKTMGVNIATIAYLYKGFNHRNWVNNYFNGGGSPVFIYFSVS